MGIKAGPKIVTDGLIFDIDAAVSRCYSGSGLTANGLVSGVGATLVNGVGFGSTNNGYFIFDGSDDYINVANPTSLQITTATICVWCKTSSPGSSYRGIVAKQYAYGLFYVSSILSAYDWAVPANNSTSTNIADDIWRHVTFTFQSGVTNGSKIYINTSSVSTFTYTISNNSNNLFIGAEANSPGQYSNCQISQVLIYNRILTDKEIMQNYNATKGRYLL